MRDTLRIRDIAAQPGEKTRGWLTIGETPAGPIQVPLVLINGKADGPVLCFTAGVHAGSAHSLHNLVKTCLLMGATPLVRRLKNENAITAAKHIIIP